VISLPLISILRIISRYASPFIFGLTLQSVSAAAALNASCDTVILTSFKKSGEKTFAQSGVGWVYSDQSKQLKVVTPAHVVWGADQILAHCQGIEISMTQLGISPTHDLAILTPRTEKQIPLKPLIVSSQTIAAPSKNGSAFLRVPSTGIRKFFVGNFTQTPAMEFDREDSLEFADLPTALARETNSGLDGVLVLSGATKPGFSGSPAFEKNSKTPVGMLLRTRNHGSQSLVLPMDRILALLPTLISGRDPWRSQNPQAPYIVYKFRGNSLDRVREIVFPKTTGQRTNLVLRELCPSGQFTSVVGGDWRDGGGGKSWKNEGEFSGLPNKVWQTTFYKGAPACDKEGLELIGGSGQTLSSGTILEQFRDPQLGLFLKISSIESLFPLIALDAKRAPERIRAQVDLKKAEVSDFSSFCRPNYFARRGFVIEESRSRDTEYTRRGTVSVTSIKLTSHPELRLDYPLLIAPNYEEETYIKCSKDSKTITLSKPYFFKLILTPTSFRFQLTLSDLETEKPECQVQLTGTRSALWQTELDHPLYKARVTLDPGSMTVAIHTDFIAAKCFSPKNNPAWAAREVWKILQ